MTKHVFSIITATVLLYTPCINATNADSARWLNGKSQGWFFYNEKTENSPLKKEKIFLPPPPSPTKINPHKKADVAPLSTAWIRENIQRYLDAATDNPTPENVSAYLYIQKYAMDKSFAFMEANRNATIGNASFDSISQRPTATFANKQLDTEATTNTKNTLYKISKNAGLFLFLDDTEASKIQGDIISMLQSGFEFDVVKIKSGELTDRDKENGLRPNNGHSQNLKIKTFPAIALINKYGGFDVISQAAVSFSDLKKRILIGASRLGVISKGEFDNTRNIRNLPSKTFDLSSLKNSDNAASSVPISQKQINKFFNRDL